jgi:hypothetical protein
MRPKAERSAWEWQGLPKIRRQSSGAGPQTFRTTACAPKFEGYGSTTTQRKDEPCPLD